jgi:hypothetical protein
MSEDSTKSNTVIEREGIIVGRRGADRRAASHHRIAIDVFVPHRGDCASPSSVQASTVSATVVFSEALFNVRAPATPQRRSAWRADPGRRAAQSESRRGRARPYAAPARELEAKAKGRPTTSAAARARDLADERRELLKLEKADPEPFEHGRWRDTKIAPAERLHQIATRGR